MADDPPGFLLHHESDGKRLTLCVLECFHIVKDHGTCRSMMLIHCLKLNLRLCAEEKKLSHHGLAIQPQDPCRSPE